MIIIPPDASLGIQRALAELEARLARLEQTPRGASPTDLSQLKTDLLKTIAAATMDRAMPDPNDNFRGGPPHAAGYVPDPGLGSEAAEQVLREDAKWTIPLSGAMPRVDVDADLRQNRLLNLLADLVINGQLSVGDILCNSLTILGLGARYACTGASGTLAVYGTEDFNSDPDNFQRQSSNTQIAVRKAGTYFVSLVLRSTGTSANGLIRVQLLKNGSALFYVDAGASSGGAGGGTLMGIDVAKPNDYYGGQVSDPAPVGEATAKFSIMRLG